MVRPASELGTTSRRSASPDLVRSPGTWFNLRLRLGGPSGLGGPRRGVESTSRKLGQISRQWSLLRCLVEPRSRLGQASRLSRASWVWSGVPGLVDHAELDSTSEAVDLALDLVRSRRAWWDARLGGPPRVWSASGMVRSPGGSQASRPVPRRVGLAGWFDLIGHGGPLGAGRACGTAVEPLTWSGLAGFGATSRLGQISLRMVHSLGRSEPRSGGAALQVWSSPGLVDLLRVWSISRQSGIPGLVDLLRLGQASPGLVRAPPGGQASPGFECDLRLGQAFRAWSTLLRLGPGLLRVWWNSLPVWWSTTRNWVQTALGLGGHIRLGSTCSWKLGDLHRVWSDLTPVGRSRLGMVRPCRIGRTIAASRSHPRQWASSGFGPTSPRLGRASPGLGPTSPGLVRPLPGLVRPPGFGPTSPRLGPTFSGPGPTSYGLGPASLELGRPASRFGRPSHQALVRPMRWSTSRLGPASRVWFDLRQAWSGHPAAGPALSLVDLPGGPTSSGFCDLPGEVGLTGLGDSAPQLGQTSSGLVHLLGLVRPLPT
ncbi:hypothetical protein FNV43_RR02123 [Rhamnella rubrinervis]|uniref:Uncharacterized protein n=1 Tax=Rhamnella rubrinervis TaxID=2594499 RepID=A0A8K0HRR5_9ROSA|nr:hypothetical protein FNV43_RR02123 [Rhamnella rubrinervis]